MQLDRSLDVTDAEAAVGRTDEVEKNASIEEQDWAIVRPKLGLHGGDAGHEFRRSDGAHRRKQAIPYHSSTRPRADLPLPAANPRPRRANAEASKHPGYPGLDELTERSRSSAPCLEGEKLLSPCGRTTKTCGVSRRRQERAIVPGQPGYPSIPRRRRSWPQLAGQIARRTPLRCYCTGRN